MQARNFRDAVDKFSTKRCRKVWTTPVFLALVHPLLQQEEFSSHLAEEETVGKEVPTYSALLQQNLRDGILKAELRQL